MHAVATRAAPHAAMLLPDDGLIDEVAVSIAVSGARRVRLTPPERDLAARAMVARAASSARSAHLGTSTAAAGRLIKALGYRLGPACPRTKHRWIMPDAA